MKNKIIAQYAIERQIEINGICGSIHRVIQIGTKIIAVVWWSAEDQIPIGGCALGNSNGSHWRIYTATLKSVDYSNAMRALA